MTAMIGLSEFYNKLVQVQLAVKVVRTLHGEVFHHLNNGASILHAAMRREMSDVEKENAFLEKIAELNVSVTKETHELMLPVDQDMIRYDIASRRLSDLIKEPATLTRDNFNALSQFHDRLNDVCTTLHVIRKNSEIALVRAAGIVPADFTL